MSFTLTLKSFFGATQSDELLMRRYAESGANDLLVKLYESCGDDLFHFILTQSDHTLAKDICQRAWLKVIVKKHLYRDSGSFKAWLFTLARNILIDEFRKNQRPTEEFAQLAVEPQLHGVLEEQFDLALTNLPFEQKEAFCLQQEGFGMQDISNITHSPIETVKSRLRYAKQSLRKTLENYHD